VTVQINTIPRTAMKATLLGLRLPLCGIEVLTGQTRNSSWPPAVAFEDFEAGVKQVVGSILRDEELVEEGRVQQAKVTELRRAVELEVQADQKRAAADRELREQLARAEDERKRAEQEALRREQVVQRDKRAAEQRVDREVSEKATTIAATAQRTAKRVTAAEREAKLTRIDQESTAVAQQRRAVRATKAAGNASDALERKKAQRQAKK
jgi:soluble cytochrome b562